MSRDYERQRQFTRRAMVFGAGKAALVLTLLGRLHYLQIIEGDKYKLLSEENRINLRLLIPPRGLIKDRRGVVMAENAQNFRLLLIPEKSGNLGLTLTKLIRILNLSEHDIGRIQAELVKRPKFQPIVVNDALEWEQMAALELHNLDLPGASIEVGQSRYYPFAEITSHALGYVAPVSEKELDSNVFGDDPLLKAPELRVGKKGVEKKYEQELRGLAGSSQLEVNAYGRVIRELATDEGKPGQDITTTLDIEIQAKAMALLEGQSGSAVVMNAHNGEVLTLASAPGFNSNLFNNGISVKAWEELLNNPRVPLTNKALAGLYSPGSTYKIVTALSALEYGLVSPRERIYCDGHTELGSAIFHCWKKGGHGYLDLVGALRESCDVYFYEIASRLGIDRLAETSRKLGLSAPTGIDVPGEKSGLVPDRRWKQQRFKKPWHLGETLIAGIGQGYVLTTPIQLARMTAQVINGNRQVAPFIVRGQQQAAAGAAPDLLAPKFKQEHLDLVIEGMRQVTMEPNGTAYAARIRKPGFDMAGKTGTSQVKRISLAERARGITKNENRPWRDRDHALFVGFAPIAQPKYVAAVVVEHGGGGSAVAAPIARDLLLMAQLRDPELANRSAAETEVAPLPADQQPSGDEHD